MKRTALWMLMGLLGLGSLALLYYPCQLDDAFITYRYAAHLVQHGTLAFNLGEPPVEGFSSPLWLALLSLSALCFGSASLPVAASWFGFTFAAASCLLAYRIAARILPEETAPHVYKGTLAALLIGTCPAIPFYASTGLEPTLFLVLSFSALASLTSVLPLWVGALSALALPWARPEAAFLPVAWAVTWFVQRAPSQRRRVIALVATLGMSLLALFALRFWIFDELLPNTYYAKLPDRAQGVRYVVAVLTSPWGGLLLLLAAFGAAVAGRLERGFFAFGCVFLLVPILEGGDWMPLGRFALPAFGAFAIAASGTLAARSQVQRAIAAAAVGALLFVNYLETQKHVAMYQATRRTTGHEYELLAAWLNQVPVRSIALMDIGVVGFQTELAVVDLAGLTDRTIAHTAGHHLRKRIDPSYVVRTKRPDVIVVRVEKSPMSSPGVLDPKAGMTQIEGDLLASHELARNYSIVMMILPNTPREPYYGRIVFIRNEIEIPNELRPSTLVFSPEPLPI